MEEWAHACSVLVKLVTFSGHWLAPMRAYPRGIKRDCLFPEICYVNATVQCMCRETPSSWQLNQLAAILRCAGRGPGEDPDGVGPGSVSADWITRYSCCWPLPPPIQQHGDDRLGEGEGPRLAGQMGRICIDTCDEAWIWPAESRKLVRKLVSR